MNVFLRIINGEKTRVGRCCPPPDVLMKMLSGSITVSLFSTSNMSVQKHFE